MKTYKLDQVSRKVETSAKTGKEYERIGLKIEGEWYNGFGKQGVTDQWEAGMEITGISLGEEEYSGKMYKNWKLISLADRILLLEQRMDKIEKNNKTTNEWD